MKRVVAGVAMLVGLLLLAVTVRVGATAMAIENGQPQSALAIDPHASTAASMLAEQRYGARDFAAAQRLATSALHTAPSDARAVRILALSRYNQGDAASATALMNQGALLGWRDLPTQLWLINQAAMVGDYQVALERADAVGRSRHFLPELTKLFRVAMRDDASRQALAGRMASQPYWRGYLLSHVSDLTPDDEAAYEQLFAAMDKAGTPPSRRELLLFVRRFAERGDYAHAFLVWQKHVDSTGAPGRINDSDFARIGAREDDSDSFPFEWDLGVREPGSEMSASGNSVRVASDGSTAAHLLRQTVLLAPGKYRVRTHLADMTVADTAGAGWTLTCLPSYAAVAPELKEGSKAIGDHSESLNPLFTVPAAGCAAQLLEIRIQPQTTPVSVDFTVDRVSIDRAS